MARRPEEEQERRPNGLGSLAKIALGVGIGYAGYKAAGRNLLEDISSAVATANVTLNRATQSRAFQGTIGEMRNLNRALDEVVEYTPAGLVRTFRSDNRFDMLNDRLGAYNKGLQTRLGREVLTDVSRQDSLLKQQGRFMSQARQDTRQTLINQLFEGPRGKELFGERATEAQQFIQENSQTLFSVNRNIGDAAHSKANLDLPVFQAIEDQINNPHKSLQLNFQNDKDKQGFMESVLRAAEEVSQETRQQEQAFNTALKKGGQLESNLFGRYANLYEDTAFMSVQKAKQPKEDFFTRSMRENGYRQVTIGDARKLPIEEQNGRVYAQLSGVHGQALQQSKTIEKYYSKPVRQKGQLIDSTPATTYTTAGLKRGIPRDQLDKDLFSTNLFLNETTGELINMQSSKDFMTDTLNNLERNWEIPFLRMNPIQFLPGRKNKFDSNDIYDIFKGGRDIQPFIREMAQQTTTEYTRNTDAFSNRLSRSYVFSDGKIIDTNIVNNLEGNTRQDRYQSLLDNLTEFQLEGDYLLGDGRSGLLRNYGEVISGNTSRDDLSDRNAFMKFMKLGGQEDESNFATLKQFFTKFDDPYYSENALNTLRQTTDFNSMDIGDGSAYKKGLQRVRDTLLGNTRNFSPGSQEAFYEGINEAFSSFNLRRSDGTPFRMQELGSEDDALEFMEAVAKQRKSVARRGDGKNIQENIISNLEHQISQEFNFKYKQSPDEYFDSKRYVRSLDNLMSSKMYMFDETELADLSKLDDVKRLFEQYGVAIADYRNINLTQGIYKNKGTSTKLSETELRRIRALNDLDYFTTQANQSDAMDVIQGMNEFNHYYAEGSPFATNFSAALKEAEGPLSVGGQPRSERMLGDSQFLAIRKHTPLIERVNQTLVQAKDQINTGTTPQEILSNVTDDVFDFAKDSRTFVAGRDGDITNASLYPWFLANRMDRTLSGVGLGLPNRDKGSAASIIFNQAFYRIGVPLIGFTYLNYMDDMTGDTVSDTLADTYVNMHMDVAGLKEVTGINQLGREATRIFPWLDQVGEIPGVKALNIATFGLIGDSRSREELEEYYTSGEDPVRKGRYWGIGSTSPWQGERINRYVPNWYRQMKSDYMYSDNLYGSKEEYWANHWLPTPTNPLAPVRRFLTDPYYYEEKNAESRPYVVRSRRGPLSYLQPTKINPRFEESHEAYLAQQNQDILATYLGMNAGGDITIRNGISLSSDSYTVEGGTPLVDEDGQLSEEALIENEASFSSGRANYIAGTLEGTPLDLSTGSVMIQGNGPGGGFLGTNFEQMTPTDLSIQDYSNAIIASINQNLIDGRTTNRNDQVAQAGTLLNPNRIEGSEDWVNSEALFSTQGVARNLRYRASEMAGMYGFLFNTTTDFSESRLQTVLEPSRRMFSMRDQFWDLDLGGLGDDVSEIFRRYVPRDRDKYYNPIPNEMPSWLPGQDYFTDFLHGDPYGKVPQAEMRLPGEAYDKLYGTRKDAYGNYSALDRFRILADIAPYSDQYRLARKEMSILNSHGLLDEEGQKEYAEIREQVSSKMKRKTFYNERFKNADVERRTVTIDKIIDQNTFLTEEFPNNPLRLAGVRVKADDQQNIELLQEMLQPGTKVEVDLDRNPQQRVRDDMYDTMRAVVYTPKAMKGTLGGLHGYGRGTNLNYYLSKQDTVTVNDDESATSTVALFSSDQRKIGALADKIVHDIMPEIPILNVVADKYLQVRSPIEAYEREVFSKSWRSWDNPITGWLQPMVEFSSSKNPAVSAARMAGIGALAYRKNRGKGALVGGLIGGIMSGVRVLNEVGNDAFGDGEIWLPPRREREYEINEYFDRITYVKYKGLYNKTAELAKEREGIDLNGLFAELESGSTKDLEDYLNNAKKWLNIAKKTRPSVAEAADQDLEQIKTELSLLEDDELIKEVGPYTALALRYKDTYESTLYAAGRGETYDYNKIYRALPYKDKPYFVEFQKAAPSERERILELVPRNQRPIYQRYFGEAIDEPISNEEYFSQYGLPDKEWDGWEAGHSLDNVKIKVMQQEGIDLTEANYWPDDEAIADESSVDAIPIDSRPSSPLSMMINTAELEKVLAGMGLHDVRVTMTSNQSDMTMVKSDFFIEQDRQQEIETGLREYMQ